MNSYQNKTILVTGASSGIGEFFARLLAKEGAKLILTARRKDRLDVLAEELSKKHSAWVQILPLDLSQHDAPQKLFEDIRNKNWTVDVLINNAGFGFKGKFWDEDPNHVSKMIDLNIRSLALLTRLFLPGMLERKEGGVLNVSSVLGLVSNPHVANYCATKNYVVAFTESLWRECKGTGVHVSCLCPGLTDTEFFGAADLKVPAWSKRIMQSPETVARAGLKGLLKNKAIVLTSVSYTFSAFLLKHFPRRLSLWIMELQSKARSSK